MNNDNTTLNLPWSTTKRVNGDTVIVNSINHVVASMRVSVKPHQDSIIVERVNAYDTLKAKADMLDELVEFVDRIIEYDGDEDRPNILDKAKELTE